MTSDEVRTTEQKRDDDIKWIDGWGSKRHIYDVASGGLMNGLCGAPGQGNTPHPGRQQCKICLRIAGLDAPVDPKDARIAELLGELDAQAARIAELENALREIVLAWEAGEGYATATREARAVWMGGKKT